jgi:hypothetical protein
MYRSPKFIVGAAAAALTVGFIPLSAGAEGPDDVVVDDLLVAQHDEPDVDPPHEGLVVFSADARIDGQRVPDELFLALGYSETYPFLASVWLLVDAEADEWAPICLGYLLGEGGRAVFVGGSTIGDEDDGCMIVPLGDEEDDSGVAFGAIELDGDSVATAAMYAIG